MAAISSAASSAIPAERPRLQGWPLASVLIALMLTLLLSALDQTIVGTALPHIAGELKGYNLLSWVGTAYLLASATLVPIIGKLSDQFGRKWFLIPGVIIFLLGSALCGAAQSMGQLIAFRAIQGIGAAALLGLIFTLVGDIFPPAERARWQGMFSIVFGLASVIGPLAGGWLTDNGPLLGTFITPESRWRWVFYVNLPIGVIALAALFIWLPNSISVRSNRYTGGESLRRVDWLGAFFIASGTVALLLGLTWGSLGKQNNGYDWNSPQIMGILLVAGVFFVALILNETRAIDPIIPLRLFGNQVFAVNAALSLLLGMAFFAVVYYLPTYVQGVLGQAATNSGVVITPLTFTLVFGSFFGGQMITRTGRYQWLVISGAFIMLIGLGLLSTLDTNAPLWRVVVFMLVLGLGIGALLPTLTLVGQNSVPRTQIGVATGTTTFVRSLGATFGIAVVGSVINSSFTTELTNRLPQNLQIPPQALGPLTNQNTLEQALTNGATHNNYGALVNPNTGITLHDTLLQSAAANVPPGPAHDQIVAGISASITTQLNQILEAAREALGVAIVNGFRSGLIVCALIVVLSFFLKDVALQGRAKQEAAKAPGQEVESEPALADFAAFGE